MPDVSAGILLFKCENHGMQFQKYLYPALAIGAIAVAYLNFKWTGVALVASGLVTWALLHFSRMMHVLKRAADRPIGYVASAVMLNAKLQPKATLLHVVAMTKSLGELQSPKDTQPEVYRWTDGSKSHVTCTFLSGRLQTWLLFRPEPPDDEAKHPSAT
jgi:hypothetical protein